MIYATQKEKNKSSKSPAGKRKSLAKGEMSSHAKGRSRTGGLGGIEEKGTSLADKLITMY